jgi:hypothetical protein
MKKFHKLIFGLLLLISSCRVYTQTRTNKEVIIDPITPSPYVIEYKSIVVLPDSLGGERYKGLAVIDGQINDSLKIADIKIMKLILYTYERDTIVNYYFGKDSLSYRSIYPPNVHVYLPFFKNYIKTVKIKKVEGVSTKNMNKTTLILRFK